MIADAALSEPPTAETLARLLAHDLRTPLNAVRGFTDLLLAGAAGPVTAPQIELLAEIARAGRALERSIGLAQEVGERLDLPDGGEDQIALPELLAGAGFVSPADQPPVVPRGDPARWRRLLETCHAHLTVGVGSPAPPTAAWLVTSGRRLELVMERTDIDERWSTSVLRERLIRRQAAAVGVLLVSEPPHAPLRLRFAEGWGGAGSA